MANLKDIKKRISSVKSTQQITKAMKMVSAAKLRRAQDAVVAARPYADKMLDVLSNLALREESGVHPLLEERGKGKALILLMTADRGLCGGFNGNICKKAERLINENPEGYESYDMMIVGRKGNEYLRSRHGESIVKVHENVTSNINFSLAALVGEEMVEPFVNGTYDAVFLVYNSFQSAIAQEQTVRQLLPIIPKQIEDDSYSAEYLYEPSRGEVLEQILPKHIQVQIFRALLESVASEHGARMTAMDSASKNAAEMIERLTLQYNRARQAAITTELMEIISGSEALK